LIAPARCPSWNTSTHNPHAAAAGSRLATASGIVTRRDLNQIPRTTASAAADTPAASGRSSKSEPPPPPLLPTPARLAAMLAGESPGRSAAENGTLWPCRSGTLAASIRIVAIRSDSAVRWPDLASSRASPAGRRPSHEVTGASPGAWRSSWAKEITAGAQTRPDRRASAAASAQPTIIEDA